MKRFEGKNIIVTGSGRGIGNGIAKHLAAEGGSVIINYLGNINAAERQPGDIANAVAFIASEEGVRFLVI